VWTLGENKDPVLQDTVAPSNPWPASSQICSGSYSVIVKKRRSQEPTLYSVKMIGKPESKCCTSWNSNPKASDWQLPIEAKLCGSASTPIWSYFPINSSEQTWLEVLTAESM
jgi:hypothetical protein